MNIMGNSIQDYLKKINSRITLLNCLSILITLLLLMVFSGYLYIKKENDSPSVTYTTYNGGKISIKNDNNSQNYLPFASVNGKTYTFIWCSGSSIISENNKIYFNTEDEAQRSGRTLSKLCQK